MSKTEDDLVDGVDVDAELDALAPTPLPDPAGEPLTLDPGVVVVPYSLDGDDPTSPTLSDVVPPAPPNGRVSIPIGEDSAPTLADEMATDSRTIDAPALDEPTLSETTSIDAVTDDDAVDLDELFEANDIELDDIELEMSPDEVSAREGETSPTDFDVDDTDDVLEQLRRGDVDGPVVRDHPQDDPRTLRRAPRRSADYDPAPNPIPTPLPRLLGRKPRVRKVSRVVRHVDPWSVFKVALIAHLVLYVVLLTAGVLLWNVAEATGTIDNVERFLESFGWSSFEFQGTEIYRQAWIGGLFAVIGLTGLAVLTATLFNLITDLVGGIRFTVLEEEVVETRTSSMRRFVIRRPEPVVPAKIDAGNGPAMREAIVDDGASLNGHATGPIPRPDVSGTVDDTGVNDPSGR